MSRRFWTLFNFLGTDICELQHKLLLKKNHDHSGSCWLIFGMPWQNGEFKVYGGDGNRYLEKYR